MDPPYNRGTYRTDALEMHTQRFCGFGRMHPVPCGFPDQVHGANGRHMVMRNMGHGTPRRQLHYPKQELSPSACKVHRVQTLRSPIGSSGTSTPTASCPTRRGCSLSRWVLEAVRREGGVHPHLQLLHSTRRGAACSFPHVASGAVCFLHKCSSTGCASFAPTLSAAQLPGNDATWVAPQPPTAPAYGGGFVNMSSPLCHYPCCEGVQSIPRCPP